MTQKYPKRLIEVDLPIKRISAHARREKSIRHGHISTLHIWWARRPLAACRAVICASLWPDPADPLCPQDFRDRASTIISGFANTAARSRELGRKCDAETWIKWQALSRKGGLNSKIESNWNILRFALLDFIADFANWDNANTEEYLETSRALTQAAHETLGGEPGTRPLVMDPFAGGGSIPLEAMRVGADAFASDLNPIPVLLNRVALEYIPTYGNSLSDEVRKWGAWMRDEAELKLSRLYPEGHGGARSVAYLWARTILSEAPSVDESPVQVPLLRTFWLSKRKDSLRALRWIRDADGNVMTKSHQLEWRGQKQTVRIPLLEIFSPKSNGEVEAGTAKGGSATCPVTGYTTPAVRVKEQLKNHCGGAETSRLYAVYEEGEQGRDFRLSSEKDLEAFRFATELAQQTVLKYPDAFPDELINPIRPFKNTRGLSAVTRIGCLSFSDLYNRRQALAIHTLYQVLQRARQQKEFPSDKRFGDAVQILLAFAVDRSVSQNTSMSRWDATRLTIKGAFSKQALAVVWDFAEANPFSGGTSDWDGALEWVCKFIQANSGLKTTGTSERGSATSALLPSDSASALITDPPYFAAIPYGDLSDFFYVWLKRGIGNLFPEMFASRLTNKDEELIVTNGQKTGDGCVKDDSFFRKGMASALSAARDAVQASGVGVVVYAEGTTAGWEAILGAIIDSQWIVTSSWPIDTEMENRTQARGAASLQSSIHIVCRPRVNGLLDGEQEAGEWRDVLEQLPVRISEWMPRLAREGVVGADAIFACLGPALEIFSKHSRVEKANGATVLLREYLEQVWAAVAKEALAMVFAGADVTGFEPDARLTAMWLWTLKAPEGPASSSDDDEDEDDPNLDEDQEDKKKKTGGFKLEFDAARKIAQGLGANLESLSHLIEIKGDEARLLPVAERTRYLFGKDEEEQPARASRKRKADAQLNMFMELTEGSDTEAVWKEKTVKRVGDTTLDRVHQAMILFAASRGEALKRFVVDDNVGQDGKFWRLAQALSALYPGGTDEKRWVDGLLARKKQLGF